MKLRVRVVGGSCGNMMFIVADHVRDLVAKAGYDCQVTTQNIWENSSFPSATDVVLQLMPAFSAADADCPLIGIRPLLVDLDHPPTIQKIMETLQQVSAAHERASGEAQALPKAAST